MIGRACAGRALVVVDDGEKAMSRGLGKVRLASMVKIPPLTCNYDFLVGYRVRVSVSEAFCFLFE
jgi:hypothetical protein